MNLINKSYDYKKCDFLKFLIFNKNNYECFSLSD